MKPQKKQTSNAPTPAAIRSRLLHRIRDAELPKDAGQFTLAELRKTGLADKYKQPADLPDGHFKALVLLATQNKELRRERDRFHQKVEASRKYYSPIRDEMRDEPDPLKQEEIRRRAEADEAQVARERAAKKQAVMDEIQKLVKNWGGRRWNDRDTRQTPYDAAFWHEPMTLMDYHEATGLIRKTIQNTLDRLGAEPLEPIAKRKRKNDPPRYGAETNFAILCEWLVRYEKKPENRRAWLARTLLKYKHDAPAHLNQVIQAVAPVLKSLDIHSEDKVKQFMDYVRQCELKLHPPPPPVPGLYELLGVSPESSVGKIG